MHWKSLILSLLIYGCLGAIAWCRLAVITTVVVYYNRYSPSQEVSQSNPCADGYIYIPIAFVILLYLVYLVECWHCHTRLELKHKVDVQTVYHKMRQMREAWPIVWWKAICYHYVRRTRQVTRYRNGDAFTSTQIYYERVNSHTSGCAFNFTNCGVKDTTKAIIGLEDYPATKIRFSKSYSFTHPDAKYEFDDQRNQFFVENERRDDYMETREGMDLLNVNFKEYMIAFKDPDNLPWYVSNIIFWVASFLLLSWPLRVIIEYKTAYLHYHVHKVFGSNYANADQQGNGEITRVNTVSSADLEMVIRNNFTIVPSYSEAVLMDINATSSQTLHDANANVTSPVLGPTRSITWNDISASTSSGYIRGFFSNHNLPSNAQRYNSCTLTNDERIGSNPVTPQSALRNIFRSPWNRKRRTNLHKENTRKTMFLLSSPDSIDEFSVRFDEQLESARVSRNHSSDEITSALKNQRTSICQRPTSSHSLVSAHGSQCTLRPLPSTSVDCDTNSAFSSSVNSQRISRKEETGLDTSNHIAACNKPTRPDSILKLPKTKPVNLLNISLQKPDIGSSRSPNGRPYVFIKSNLPNVPISNILSETSPVTDTWCLRTPASPPCYEDALSMPQASTNADQPGRSGDSTENSQLLALNESQPKRYHAIMETSL